MNSNRKTTTTIGIWWVTFWQFHKTTILYPPTNAFYNYIRRNITNYTNHNYKWEAIWRISVSAYGVFSIWKIMKWIIFFCSMNIFRIIAKNVGSNWIFSRNMNFSCVSQIQPKCEHSLLDIIVVVEQKIWTRSHSRQYKINTSDIQNEKKNHISALLMLNQESASFTRKFFLISI